MHVHTGFCIVQLAAFQHCLVKQLHSDFYSLLLVWGALEIWDHPFTTGLQGMGVVCMY